MRGGPALCWWRLSARRHDSTGQIWSRRYYTGLTSLPRFGSSAAQRTRARSGTMNWRTCGRQRTRRVCRGQQRRCKLPRQSAWRLLQQPSRLLTRRFRWPRRSGICPRACLPWRSFWTTKRLPSRRRPRAGNPWLVDRGNRCRVDRGCSMARQGSRCRAGHGCSTAHPGSRRRADRVYWTVEARARGSGERLFLLEASRGMGVPSRPRLRQADQSG
mmetsp:Transcript_33534/g.87204  ORF Transcript_33534/g.87204 Transcript_33534/m.87204 type:complete len:216 (-) Transcript_33534:692-1339(-)